MLCWLRMRVCLCGLSFNVSVYFSSAHDWQLGMLFCRLVLRVVWFCCYLVCFCQEKRRSVDKKSHARMILREKEKWRGLHFRCIIIVSRHCEDYMYKSVMTWQRGRGRLHEFTICSLRFHGSDEWKREYKSFSSLQWRRPSVTVSKILSSLNGLLVSGFQRPLVLHKSGYWGYRWVYQNDDVAVNSLHTYGCLDVFFFLRQWSTWNEREGMWNVVSAPFVCVLFVIKTKNAWDTKERKDALWVEEWQWSVYMNVHERASWMWMWIWSWFVVFVFLKRFSEPVFQFPSSLFIHFFYCLSDSWFLQDTSPSIQRLWYM